MCHISHFTLKLLSLKQLYLWIDHALKCTWFIANTWKHPQHIFTLITYYFNAYNRAKNCCVILSQNTYTKKRFFLSQSDMCIMLSAVLSDSDFIFFSSYSVDSHTFFYIELICGKNTVKNNCKWCVFVSTLNIILSNFLLFFYSSLVFTVNIFPVQCAILKHLNI